MRHALWTHARIKVSLHMRDAMSPVAQGWQPECSEFCQHHCHTSSETGCKHVSPGKLMEPY